MRCERCMSTGYKGTDDDGKGVLCDDCQGTGRLCDQCRYAAKDRQSNCYEEHRQPKGEE